MKIIDSFTYIRTTKELERACSELETNEYLALDTEFSREKTYYPTLSLIQIASQEHNYIIDALSEDIDLSIISPILTNPQIIKIFHSVSQDAEALYYTLGIVPSPIFDTQIASMVCGYGDAISYAKLVKEYTNITLDKSNRYTDWIKRPLTDAQIEYALNDVRYLRKVYKDLQSHIIQKNRASWIEEEMKELDNIDLYITKPEEAWRKIKPKELPDRAFMTLQALAEWREKNAQKQNRPRTKICNNATILKLATERPDTEKRILHILNKEQSKKSKESAEELNRLISEINAIPKNENLSKNLTKRESAPSPVIGLLKILLHIKSNEHKVAEKLIATKSELLQIAKSNHTDKSIKPLAGWRYEIFGQHAVNLCSGKTALAFSQESRKIIEVSLNKI